MNESKPIYASKTLWVNLVALVVSVAAAFGVDLGLDTEAQASLVGGIMAVVNIALRMFADKPVSVKKKA